MNEKIENMLNMALDLSPEELNKSQELAVGFDAETDFWDLIIRYTRLDRVREIPGITVRELSGGYAIVNLQRNYIEKLANLEEVIYIEKPKSLEFAFDNGKQISCINQVQVDLPGQLNLYGEGVIVGIVDSGIDYTDKAFLDSQGGTRILRLWDQVLDRVFTKDEIDIALESDNPRELIPSIDITGHGTNVAKIAAGNFAPNLSENRGIATKSQLVVVKMATGETNSFPRTTQLMEAVDYVMKVANEYNMPCVINISFGNTYGSHDGTSLLSTYLNSVIDDNVTAICIGSGNEGDSAGHIGGKINNVVGSGPIDRNINEGNIGSQLERNNITEIELQVGNFQNSFSIQIWKDYVDIWSIEIVAPSGETTGVLVENNTVTKSNIDETTIAVLFGSPKPYSRFQEIYVQLIPNDRFVASGIWIIRLIPENIVFGQFDLWLPSSNALDINTRFLNSTVDTTLTVPSATNKAITVGAYDGRTSTVASFSGRGFTRQNNQVKPDIVAPGVNIQIPDGDIVSGTSFATPFVAGSVALMMEWGIVNGNDRFLYGEKVKAYLIRGARRFPQIEQWPSPQAGWGALCLRDSFPI